MQSQHPDIPSVSDLLNQAIDFHMQGQLEKAAAIYETVLTHDAHEPVALHYHGILLHQTGRHQEAIEQIRLSCALQPRNADWLNDFGNVLFALERFDAAIPAYEKALAVTPGNHEIWNNLGSTQLQQGNRNAAVTSFRRALDIKPDFAPPLLHLANIFEAAGNKMESTIYQCRAFVLPPHEGKSRQMLGISFYFLGRLQEAADIYRQWMNEEPDNPIPQHMHAACAQQAMPQRASDRYIEAHFDNMAATFDTNLVDNLEYNGPAQIRDALKATATANRQFDTLDLGCGTGLCGAILAPYAKRLSGVDLSEKMLERATARGMYDQLKKQEITAFLQQHPLSFDLIVSADTLIYFGNLEQVFTAVSRALRPDGLFIFTAESVSVAGPQTDTYHLHPSGRYRHTETYLKATLAQAGLRTIRISNETIRKEIGQPIAGVLMVAQRTT